MTGRPGRGPALLVLVWLAGVVVATSVGLLAVRLVAAQVGDPAVTPLSAAAAASAVPVTSAPPAPTAPPTPVASAPASAPPSTGPAPVTRAFSSAGGEMGVRCTGTALQLLYTAPAEGYALDERSAGGSEAEARFEGAGTRVRLRVSCASGAPSLLEQRTDPEGGGDDGGDDGGGGDDEDDD